jgi:hypothetical protein
MIYSWCTFLDYYSVFRKTTIEENMVVIIKEKA